MKKCHNLPMALNAFAAGVALMAAINAVQLGWNRRAWVILTAANLVFVVINWRLG